MTNDCWLLTVDCWRAGQKNENCANYLLAAWFDFTPYDEARIWYHSGLTAAIDISRAFEKAEVGRPEDRMLQGKRKKKAKLLHSKFFFPSAFCLFPSSFWLIPSGFWLLLSNPECEFNLKFPVCLMLRLLPLFACGGFAVFAVEDILLRTRHPGSVSVSPNLGKLGT